MKEEIYLPRMGQTMTEGTIDKWLKKDGDIVLNGEGVVEITTDKVTTTIESPKSGILQILREEGNTVPVGEVIAEVIDEE
jgi:pyruvate/2-oxoglutarate dehydrogenase complex dihydrolipoamide acyltransferase (E2) component